MLFFLLHRIIGILEQILATAQQNLAATNELLYVAKTTMGISSQQLAVAQQQLLVAEQSLESLQHIETVVTTPRPVSMKVTYARQIMPPKTLRIHYEKTLH